MKIYEKSIDKVILCGILYIINKYKKDIRYVLLAL